MMHTRLSRAARLALLHATLIAHADHAILESGDVERAALLQARAEDVELAEMLVSA